MTIREEKMRIAGKKVDGDSGKVVEVFNPYNNELVGTVPRASREQVSNAFEIAANYKPTLSRYDRQLILTKIANKIVERKDEISDLITAECGLSKKDYTVDWTGSVSFKGELTARVDKQHNVTFDKKASAHLGKTLPELTELYSELLS